MYETSFELRERAVVDPSQLHYFRVVVVVQLQQHTHTTTHNPSTTIMTASSSSTAVLVAGSALLAAAGLRYLVATTNSTMTSNNNKPSSSVLLLSEDITAREVCEIYYRLLADLQLTYLDLVRQIQTRLQELRGAGHLLDDDDVSDTAAAAADHQSQQRYRNRMPPLFAEALRVELERSLAQKQSALLQEFDMEQECLEEAVQDFVQEQNPDVLRAVATFRTFWESCML
jgi:sulfur transfer complex TusBCD TusB component (DsrH family)